MKNSVFQPSWVKGTKSTRFYQLKHFFVNQEVLDIGCAVGYKKEDWMHRNIKAVTRSLYGLDLDAYSVDEIRKMGFEVFNHDAQDFDIGKKFDLIHAGELIEHLDNFNGFLTCAKKHLRPEGRILITTPNALRMTNFLYSLSGGLRVNAEHTCWFCETTMKTLLERMGFEVVEIGYLKHSTFNIFRRILLTVRALILPDRLAWNTLYVVAKVKKG